MRLYKSTEDRVIMGICGGISKSFGLKVRWVRLIAALLIIGTLTLLLWVYLIAGLLLPFEEEKGLYEKNGPLGRKREPTERQRQKIQQNERDTWYRPPDGKS